MHLSQLHKHSRGSSIHDIILHTVTTSSCFLTIAILEAHIWFILPHCPVSTQWHTMHTVHQIAKFSAHLNWRPAAENKGCSSPKHHQGQSPPAAEEMQAEQKSSIESLHLIDTLSKQERQINNGNWQSFKCFKRKKYQCYHLVAYFQDDTLNIYLFNRTIL